MPATADWKIPASAQPRAGDYDYDLEAALSAVVSLSARVPSGAFTAETLGTERAGNGVLIDGGGVVLTIGYLITEADQVWLTANDGRTVPGHVVGYDQTTGFGLVQALGRLDLPPLPLGDSIEASVGTRVVVAGAGGRGRSVAAQVVARQEFAGYWEYVLDDAIFTAPAHPHWGGTAVIGGNGHLLGIGSLQLQAGDGKRAQNINMVVPIDLLKPVMDDILTLGRPNRPARPWLGFFATEIDDEIVVMGLAGKGPAERAGVQVGDALLAVGGEKVVDLAGLFRRVWSLGEAGVSVPLTLRRDGRTVEIALASASREQFLAKPRLH